MIISCDQSSTNYEPKAVTFSDANFELVIREALEIPMSDILDTDLESLIYLSGTTRNITALQRQSCESIESEFHIN